MFCLRGLGVQLILAIALVCSAAHGSDADADADWAQARAQTLKTYKSEVAPFIAKYCQRCHTARKKKGGVIFDYALKTPGAASFRPLWKRASAKIDGHDMPPDDEEKQPSEQERKAIVAWIAEMKHLHPRDPGPFVIRRLSKVEYGNTLHDLFGVDPQIAHGLPDEVFGAGYTNSISPLLMEQYLVIANDVLHQAFGPSGAPPTPLQQRLFGATPAARGDRDAAARKVAGSLARRAFRRPPSDAEIAVLMRVFALATDQGKPYPDALRLMLKAILVSPQFLFITPEIPGATTDTNAPGDIVALDDYQLASRLSYFLWATLPDAELSALADAGKLHEPAVLAAQARRMLLDPRSRALFDGFGAQWLGLDKLAGKTFDPAKFPEMTSDVRSAMYEEARLLFESILHENRSLVTFIDSDYAFLNGTLARIYGLEKTVAGPQMRKVNLHDANRGGILTMPGVLAMTSFPNRTSAVNRGVWVVEQVLGETVPPPPPNIPALEKQDPHKVATLTLRQRTELHRHNAVCASCHKVFDPIGFGLENFDAIGRWRNKDDSGGPIDPTGELPGGHRFTTPAQLKQIIAARKDDFCHALAGKLLAYALCHQVEGYDEVVVDQLADTAARDDYRMQTLVVGVVTSYPFTHRRVNNPVAVSGPK